jgi:PAS domain S-box-containing protein
MDAHDRNPSSESAPREPFLTLFDAMPQLGGAMRPDGFVDYYNRGWYEFTGSTFESMAGWGWTSVHHPDFLATVLDRWRRSLETGESFEAECRLRRHDGVFRWFLTRANPMRDESGRIVRWVGIATDIEDQKRAEAAAAASTNVSIDGERQRHLEGMLRARDDLLAMVSHDLRNPLNIIVMAATRIEHLASSDVADPSRRPARIIIKAAERMTRLVSDLLDLSKLEAGQPLPLDLETHDVVELVREAIEALAPVAQAKRITLMVEPGPNTHVRCDGDRVQQVLSNLIGNALKFTHAGGSIAVRSRVKASEVVVSVCDTGIGIAPAQLPNIFDRYWQNDGQPERGAGLGLYIAKAIVTAHGGSIWVDSAQEVGSNFHFSLPRSCDLAAKEQR